MSSIKGAPQLRARLRAIKVSFKPIGREWAEDTIDELRPRSPHRTGKGISSYRVKNSTMTKATVSGIYYMSMLDKGTKAHDIVPRRASVLRFQVGQRAVFAKKVHIKAKQGLHFAKRAALEAMRQNPMAEALIKEWNKAA